MNRVDSAMHDAVQSKNEALTAAAAQLMDAGGKRVRPLFALICSRVSVNSSPEVPNSVISVASALELIHMATLVHDDVIDDASLRRGQPTVRSRFGNRPAMYCGDFLFAKAISLLCQVDHPTVHSTMSTAMVRMCEGELDQLGDFFNWNQSLRRYLRRIERKTALLISVSCELGALVGGGDPQTAIMLGRFGYYTGMSYQITDDILDYVGDEQTIGKPVGGDLRQGNLTLPALRAAALGGGGSTLPQLVHVGMDDESIAHAIEIVRDSEAMGFARDLSVRYMEKALDCLQRIDQNHVALELEKVAKALNRRMH